MFALLSRRFRAFLLLAVGAPIAGWTLERLGERLEARGGPTTLTRNIHRTRGYVRRLERGPFARR